MYDRKAGRLGKAVALWHELGRLEREGHQPRVRSLREIVSLGRRNRISPLFYLHAGLYRRELAWQDKLDYMSSLEVYNHLGEINQPEHHFVARNKLITHGLFMAFAIPTPPFYGVVDANNGRTFDGHPLCTANDLVDLLRRLDLDTVCFKYIAGTRGKGFYRMRVDCDRHEPVAQVLPDGNVVPLPQFWEQLLRTSEFGGYFCQGVVEQHPDVARYNPWSLNTVRSWMVKDDGGEWYMYAAALRMGLGRTSVDNISQGGLGSPVDVETGRLAAAIREEVDHRPLDEHPVTGVRFAGETLPAWPEALRLCHRTAGLFPYYELVAVDVAFSTEGPMIIEVGATPDEPQLYFQKGVRPLLSRLLERRRAMERRPPPQR